MVPGSGALVLGNVPRGVAERRKIRSRCIVVVGLRCATPKQPTHGIPAMSWGSRCPTGSWLVCRSAVGGRGPGSYAVRPWGDVWTCFSRTTGMSFVISCLCVLLSVTLTCADVLKLPLRYGDVDVCACCWGFMCRLYLWPATLEV